MKETSPSPAASSKTPLGAQRPYLQEPKKKDTVSVGEKDELFDAVQKTGSGGCVSIRKGGEVRTHQWGF
jgi:hypothetical protein